MSQIVIVNHSGLLVVDGAGEIDNTVAMKLKNSKLPKLFRDRRLAAGLAQSDVAKALGYSSSQFVSNWERGLADPPKNIIKKLLKLYKIDPDLYIEIVLDEQRRELMRKLK